VELALGLESLAILVRLGLVIAKPGDRGVDLGSVRLRGGRVLATSALPLVWPSVPLTVVGLVSLLLVVPVRLLGRAVKLALLIPRHAENPRDPSLDLEEQAQTWLREKSSAELREKRNLLKGVTSNAVRCTADTRNSAKTQGVGSLVRSVYVGRVGRPSQIQRGEMGVGRTQPQVNILDPEPHLSDVTCAAMFISEHAKLLSKRHRRTGVGKRQYIGLDAGKIL
jgi:hypothetical protein